MVLRDCSHSQCRERIIQQVFICTVSHVFSFIVVTLRYNIVLDVKDCVYHSVTCSRTRRPELSERSSKVLENLHNYFPVDTASQ